MGGEDIGQLTMLDDGTWAYMSEARIPGDVGDIVELADVQSRERHVFGISAVYPWGASLSRLEGRPIATSLRGTFSNASRTTCFGVGSTSDCIDDAPFGTLFSVFEARDGRLVFDAVGPRRIGRIRSGDPTSAVWVTPPNQWVAVPESMGFETPKFRLGASGCKLSQAEALDLPDPHPVDAEIAAFKDMVDAYIQCDGKNVRFVVPSALRRALPSRDPRLRTHPLVAIYPDSIEADPEVVARFVGYVGVGDFDAASLFVREIAPSNPKFALYAAEISAAAGRPDEALAIAYRATSSSWNREGDFYWVFLRARVALLLGDEAAFVKRWGRLPEMSTRLENTDIHGWIVWQAFEAETVATTTYRTYDESLKGGSMKPWRALLRLSAAVNKDDQSAASTFVAMSGDSELARALLGENPAKTGTGVLDIYGRMWAAGQSGQLSTVGSSRFHPGYKMRDATTAEDPIALNRILGRTTEPAAVAAGIDCGQAATPRVVFGRDWAAQWAASTGHDLICESAAALIASWDTFTAAQHTSLSPYFDALLDWRLRNHPSPKGLIEASMWAANTHREGSCRRWNLAVAYSQLYAREVEPTEAALRRANACRSRDYLESEKILAAALSWLKTGRVSGDSEREVKTRIAKRVRNDVEGCALLAPSDVNLDDLAEPDVAALIVELPSSPDKLFKVVSAWSSFDDARTNLREFQSMLRAGDSAAAALKLASARENARAAGNQPLMKRIALLEDVLFDGDATHFDASAKTKSKSAAARLRAGDFRAVASWTPTEQAVAQLLNQPLEANRINLSDVEMLKDYCGLAATPKEDGSIDLDTL